MAPFEIFNELLGACGGRKKLVSRLGPAALDPIAEFLNLALTYEKSQTPSLEGFLQWVVAGEVEIKRDLEQSKQYGVRVMTVHGAKGLEAPIVFLPDTMQIPRLGSSLIWHQDASGTDKALFWAARQGLLEDISLSDYEKSKDLRDQEHRRLVYVAMTRAEDRLYICGWGTRVRAPENCWYNLVKAGVAEIGKVEEDDFLREMGETENNEVIRIECRQRKLIKSRPKSAVTSYGNLPSWAFTKPTYEPLSPSLLTPSRIEESEHISISPLESSDEGYFKRGKAIHTLLQVLPEVIVEKREEVVRRFLGQNNLDLSTQEQREIESHIFGILNDKMFWPLFGPGSRAEVAVTGLISGRIISGQIDRLLVKPKEVLIVDYKTNCLPPLSRSNIDEVYLRQMAMYRLLLKEIYPEKEIKCALLWTVGPNFMHIDRQLLNKYEVLGG